MWWTITGKCAAWCRIYAAFSSREAESMVGSGGVDLIILDVNMPGEDGFSFFQRIKPVLEQKRIPVLFLSARDQDEDKLLGLGLGADDYMTKPFDIKELLARIVVQFRDHSQKTDGDVLEFEGVQMNTVSHVVSVEEHGVRLTKTEYAILKLLMQNPTQVITKSLMLDRISEDTPDCMESSLNVHISNLRKKLRDVNGRDYIETVWGIGFKMKEV